MSENISGFGLSANIKASNTFPEGIAITQFADDVDPIDHPELVIAESASGLNGDLIVWSKANPVHVTVAVIPNSEDDQNLGILFEANRTGKGKSSARDSISISVNYPDGSAVLLGAGTILAGFNFTSTASAGRFKTKTYKFVFESTGKAG